MDATEALAKQMGCTHVLQVVSPPPQRHRQKEWVRKWKLSQSFPLDPLSDSQTRGLQYSVQHTETDTVNQSVLNQPLSAVITSLTGQHIRNLRYKTCSQALR